jgi:LPXTG-motif cell wall-anchored protein
VREANADTLVVANGFSCREQIAQTTPRRALHLAEVIDLAQRTQAALPGDAPPATEHAEPADPSKTEALLAIGAGLALAGAATWWFTRRRRAVAATRRAWAGRTSDWS